MQKQKILSLVWNWITIRPHSMHFTVALLSLEDYTALPFVSPVTAKGLMNRERNVSTRFRTSA